MKGTFKKIGAAVLAAVMVVGLPRATFAATFKDVPSNSYYYEAVSVVTDLGLMVGDSAGNFKIDDMISKFDSAVVFAKAAGYKSSGATAAEKAEYDAAYKEYLPLINSYAARYARWNSSVNYEIAYLLYKGVFVRDDMAGFFRNVDGVDRLRALSKEEACAYVTRLIGKDGAAKAYSLPASASRFKDDAAISAEYRNYVYYLKSIGVITGEPGANFSPNSGITKGVLALLLYRVRESLPISAKAGQGASGAITVVSGVIDKIYPTFKAVYLTSSIGAVDGKIYPVTDGAEIKIDGKKADFSGLAVGMTVTAGVSGDGIVTLDAVREVSAIPPSSSGDTGGGAVIGETPVLQTFEGVVVSSSDSSVEVELRLLTIKGEVYLEKRVFAVGSACPVYRNGAAAKISSAVKGDAVVLRLTDGVVKSVELLERFRALSGVVLEKRVTQDGVVWSVSDSNTKRVFEVTAGIESKVTRNNESARYSAVKVGDSFTAALEYDEVLTITAYGEKSVVLGWVEEIVISAKNSNITITDESGKVLTFYASGENINDFYSVRVGDKVSVRLDSLEVEGVAVVSAASVKNFSTLGTVVYNAAQTYVTVSEGTGYFGAATTFTINSQTIIIDAQTGARVGFEALTAGRRVYVVYNQSDPSSAKTITILSY